MCNTTLTKYLLFTFNLLILLFGLFLLAVGIWAHVDSENFLKTVLDASGNSGGREIQDALNELSMYINLMAWFVIGLGGIISIIALFGCCGAFRESRCCLGFFFALLLICFLATVVLGGFILFVAATGNSKDNASSTIREAFEQVVKSIWNMMSDEDRANFEKAHECCGIDSSLNSLGHKFSCAITPSVSTQNCQSKLIEVVQNKFYITGGIILGVAVIEVIGMSMACVLFNRFAHVYTAV